MKNDNEEIPNLIPQFVLNVRGDLVEWMFGHVRDMRVLGIEPKFNLFNMLWLYAPKPFDGTMFLLTGSIWAHILPKTMLPDLRAKEISFQIFSNVDFPFVTELWSNPEDPSEEPETAKDLPTYGDIELMLSLLEKKMESASVAAAKKALKDELYSSVTPEELDEAKNILGDVIGDSE